MDKQLLVKILFSGIFLFIIVGNIRAIQSSMKGMGRINEAEAELDEIKNETAVLGDKIEYAKTDDYLEKEALERFKLVKEPSTVLIVEGAKTVEQKEVEKKTLETSDMNISNVRKWVEFFKF